MRCAECLRLARGKELRGNQRGRKYPALDGKGRICAHYNPGKRHVFRNGICKCGQGIRLTRSLSPA